MGLSPAPAGLSSPSHFAHAPRGARPTTPRMPKHEGFGLLPGRSPLLGESFLFSFPAGTKMFQFPALASRNAGWHPVRMPGCPIRKSADQRPPAPPRGFSQLVTSFLASESLGIRRTPLSCFSGADGFTVRAILLSPLHPPAHAGRG